MIYQKFRAFTIVELLVVVTIIGILAAAITVSVLGFRGRSRDSRRAADFSTVEKTLAAYYSDHFKFPTEFENICDTSIGSIGHACPFLNTDVIFSNWSKGTLLISADSFYDDLVPTYISSLPVDPLNNRVYYYYYEPTDGAATGVYPDQQCFTWIYALESGGRRVVREDVGDVSWNTTYPNTCESQNPAVTF